ncbi:MAG: S1 RNA-binding domain-containing protein [Clostridia bacterium]|nr:S1 RNA-binding domain-containing protein [Clostridia bacterium]
MPLNVGDILNGTVTGITNFGAFVDLPDKESGMVHISEIASSFVKEISDFIAVGDEVKVKVIGVDEKGKVALSIKQAMTKEEIENEKEKKKKNKPKPNVWQGQRAKKSEDLSFEEMMSKFKQVSEEKIAQLKRANETKQGGYSKRSSGRRK